MKNFDISLYGILDPEHSRDRNLADLATIAADNGVTLLQYRDKINQTRHMVAAVSAILGSIEGSDIKLIVNDRVDVALAAGAHGVHLGPDDMDAVQARSILGEDMIIGVSVKTLEGAESVPLQSVDYAFIGGVFNTTSKDNKSAMGVSGWSERAKRVRALSPDFPIGAIAGLTPENCGSLIEAGANGIAAIAALFEADDVAKSVRNFRNAIENAR